MNSQGDAAFKKLIEQYKRQKNYVKVDECYKTLISIARKANNAGLVARTYDKYIVWTDSVKALTAQDELNILKKKYDESLTTIQEKDDSLSAKQYIIIGLCVLAAILAAALVIGAIVLLRFIMLTRKQKKAIAIANEHNELKTKFIQNISAQMEPDRNRPWIRSTHSCPAYRHYALSPVTSKSCPSWKTVCQSPMKYRNRTFQLSARASWTK